MNNTRETRNAAIYIEDAQALKKIAGWRDVRVADVVHALLACAIEKGLVPEMAQKGGVTYPPLEQNHDTPSDGGSS